MRGELDELPSVIVRAEIEVSLAFLLRFRINCLLELELDDVAKGILVQLHTILAIELEDAVELYDEVLVIEK